MLNFMREGGLNMWLMLATAIATAGIALSRGRDARSSTFVVGMAAVLIEGMMGLATGLAAVSHNYARFPDPVAAIAEGLGELSHNGTFAAALATVFGVAALATAQRPTTAS